MKSPTVKQLKNAKKRNRVVLSENMKGNTKNPGKVKKNNSKMDY